MSNIPTTSLVSMTNRIFAAAVDEQGLDTVSAAVVETAGVEPSLRVSGVNNEPIVEPIAKYIRAPAEKVLKYGNSYIVLGRDRPGARDEGYGGKGHTHASSLDLVVGRNSSLIKSGLNYDPNFADDAARLYISQKTDIDDNFGLPVGRRAGPASRARSAAALKADAVRIIGRDSIKLVTRTESTNSRGGTASHNGIYLIASNDSARLQPMVKGNSLVSNLKDMDDRIRDLHTIVLKFQKEQHKYNMKLMTHNHLLPLGPNLFVYTHLPALDTLWAQGVQTALTTVECIVDNFKSRINLELMEFKYLSGITGQGFNSSYNKVN